MIRLKTVLKMRECLASMTNNSFSHDYDGEDLVAMLNELACISLSSSNCTLWEWLNKSCSMSHFGIRVPVDSPLIPIMWNYTNIFSGGKEIYNNTLYYTVSVLELTKQLSGFREEKI